MRMDWSSIEVVVVVAQCCEDAQCCSLFTLKGFISMFCEFHLCSKMAIENYFWMMLKKSWGRGAGFARQTWSGRGTRRWSDPGLVHLRPPGWGVALPARGCPARMRPGARERERRQSLQSPGVYSKRPLQNTWSWFQKSQVNFWGPNHWFFPSFHVQM